ncbi:MAG: UPF0149 family protein [Gammaproteobacteria bacterium]|nr:UPF0149 family protein [Gammaproteobacteria bacterium]
MIEERYFIDFYEFSDVLHDVQITLGGAESHGVLCGLLCVQGSIDVAAWISYIDSSEHANNAEGPHSLSEEQRITLTKVRSETMRQLNDAECNFQPLLPSDNNPLGARTEALSEWSRGFLFGLVSGGLKKIDPIPAIVNEVVRDLVALSQADHVNTDSDNDNEAAYAELVEYLRSAALLTYEELQPPEKVPTLQ